MMGPAGAAPIEVMVVDDSAVIRRFVTEVLTAEPDIVVNQTAQNGQLALARLEAHQPDVVILDIEMPVLDGLSTLEQLRKAWPDLPVVMFSTLTTRGASATLDALALGATDYVSKPSRLGDLETARAVVAAELVPVVRSCAAVRRSRLSFAKRTTAPTPTAPPVPARPLARSVRRSRAEVLVIASSTGGPHALGEVIPKLPATLPVPVLVVQHMPELFTELLADRLGARSALKVHHGADGMAVEPGNVYVAPGGKHLFVRRAGPLCVLGTNDDAPENSVRPAADVLFRSAAAHFGAGVLGLVLTGMGCDGLAGSRAIREAGGCVYVQDEASSVVWGMPGSVAKEGLAEAAIPLGEIAGVLTQQLQRASEVVA